MKVFNSFEQFSAPSPIEGMLDGNLGVHKTLNVAGKRCFSDESHGAGISGFPDTIDTSDVGVAVREK